MEDFETSPAAGSPENPQAEASQTEKAPSADGVSVEEFLPPAEAPPPASLEDAHLTAVLEALVYVAEEPLTLAQIASALQQPPDHIRALLEQRSEERRVGKEL